jgi:AcrR family transcriptional regulator
MNSPKASKKQQYHHGDLKQALLDETARILNEEGEQALSLRNLAANLGVSRTAPYNHFKNKESLLAAVAEEGFRRFNLAMKNTRAKHRESDSKTATIAVVKAYVDFARKNQAYYDLMYGGQPWRGGKPAKSLSSAARGTLRSDVERLQRGQARGIFAKDLDALRFAQVYWGTLHGISRLLLDGVFTDSTSVSRLCESAAEMLWQQLDPDRSPG